MVNSTSSNNCYIRYAQREEFGHGMQLDVHIHGTVIQLHIIVVHRLIIH